MAVLPLRRKDTKVPIVGTKDHIPGVAHITGVDEDGVIEYAGGTDIWWDDQFNLQEDGGPIYIDDNGHEVLHHNVERYEPEADA